MATTSTVQTIFWPKENRFIKETLLVLGAVVLLFMASQLSIPLKPVPMTFQSTTVVLIGMALGMRLGIIAVVSYLVAGFLGAPVFANFYSGFQVMLDPTAGYLVGFLPAVALTGLLAQEGYARSVIMSFMTALAGTVIIFACGVTVLAQFTGWDNAIQFGIAPFVVTELIKLAAMSFCVPKFWKHG